MQSKTSYFSKTIFLKNITHYWPIWVGYLLLCLIRLPLCIFTNLHAHVTDVVDMEAFRVTLLKEAIEAALHPFSFFLFACITAVAVFSYLYQARSANMFHAFPLCRETLFITNVLSGISFLVIPQIIAFLAGIFVCFFEQMTQLEFLLHWLLLSTGMVIFAFALAVTMVMITGNIIAAPVFFFIVNYLFVACRKLFSEIITILSFGVENTHFTFGDILSPYYFLVQHFGGYSLFTGFSQELAIPEAYGYVGGYFAASIPLFIIAFLLYKKKHLETVGDFLAISWLKPIFRWGAAICIGSGIAILGQSFFAFDNKAGNTLLIMLPLLILGSIAVFFLAEMLLQKNFKIFSKKKFAECSVIVVLLSILVIGIDLNVFGMETKIPKEENIETIYFNGIYPIDVREEDFSQVLAFHQTLIDSKKELEDYFQKYSQTTVYTSVELSYGLAGNKTLTRTYYLPITDAYLEREDSLWNQIAEFSHNPEYYLRYHFTDSYESVTFVEGNFDVYTGSEYLDTVLLDQAQCIQVYEAFKKDLQEGNYRIYNFYDGNNDKIYHNSLCFSYHIPESSTSTDYNDFKTISETEGLQWTSISLTTDCVHTIEALEELGIVNENQKLLTRSQADKLFEEEAYEDIKYY